MNRLFIFIFLILTVCTTYGSQNGKLSFSPKLPTNIPPPPNFGNATNKNGRFQLISAEYYSQDSKPFLYKRLIKIDTQTGKAWILISKGGPTHEVRTWLPLISGE